MKFTDQKGLFSTRPIVHNFASALIHAGNYKKVTVNDAS